MANKRQRQTFGKRNRERAVEEKRTLKRLRKQEKREAARSGEPIEAPPLAEPPTTDPELAQEASGAGERRS
jgi:hypothetical protein